ncbi:MAG: DUF2304 domain-containing protein [Solirubrobacterales bacterium]
MDSRVQIFVLIAAGGLLLIVLELVRRRRLMERYALLWLLSGLVLCGLAVNVAPVENLARAIGVVDAPNALFLVAFGFVLLLLLHFSTVISSLTDQNKILAQRLAQLEERLRHRERIVPEATEHTVDEYQRDSVS